MASPAARVAFQPAWWLAGPHAQTLFASLVPRSFQLSIRRERIELPDGDFLDLDWVGQRGPIVLILHGLQGSIRSKYARGLLQAIQRRGWRGALLHFRGCSGEPNRLPRGYHSGETTDLAYVVAELLRREPTTSLAVVGYSLGGNVLLKWLGETGAQNPLTAAVAVSVPFELGSVAETLERGVARLYRRHLVESLKAAIATKMQRVDLGIGLKGNELSAIRTFRQFDDRVTAPLHGFRDANDYYARASCKSFMKDITTKTLVLHARNDPFMSPTVIPQQREVSKSVSLEVSDDGGHVGFVSSGGAGKPEYWLEKWIPAFLGECFK